MELPFSAGNRHRFPVAHVRLGKRIVRYPVLVLAAIATAAAIDLSTGDWGSSSVPLHYPFFLDMVFIGYACFALWVSHEAFDRVKGRLLERLSEGFDGIPTGHDVPRGLADKIRKEVDEGLDFAYGRTTILVSGALGGAVLLGIMKPLGYMEHYPYAAMNFLFGAVHGILVVPGLIAFYFAHKLTREYIHDIDALDAGGFGGFRGIANVFATLVSYLLLGSILDLAILYSTEFTGNPTLIRLAYGLYLGCIAVALVGIVWFLYRMRRRISHLLNLKIDWIQKQLRPLRLALLHQPCNDDAHQKLTNDYLSLRLLAREVQSHSLWPLSWSSFSKVAITGLSAVAFLVQRYLDVLAWL